MKFGYRSKSNWFICLNLNPFKCIFLYPEFCQIFERYNFTVSKFCRWIFCYWKKINFLLEDFQLRAHTSSQHWFSCCCRFSIVFPQRYLPNLNEAVIHLLFPRTHVHTFVCAWLSESHICSGLWRISSPR